jgi:hypothetical protein
LLPKDVIIQIKHLFNHCIQTQETPKQWKKSITILLLKKGDPTKITNYRPIALMQSIAKLYESIIKDRLIKNITLHPAQAAFQKG